MRQKILQQARAEELRSLTRSNIWKVVYGISFAIGFLLFAILGKKFAEENTLLDVASLRAVKDTVIERSDFFCYVFWRRILWIFLGFLAWWWGYGKWYTYSLLGFCGFSMGACLQTALLRYSVKGLTLWIFLYFPYIIFYTAALFWGILLCRREETELKGADTYYDGPHPVGIRQEILARAGRGGAAGKKFLFGKGAGALQSEPGEKRKRLCFLIQNIWIVLGLLVLVILGIYGEACVNPSLLQKYLQFF